MTTQDTPTPEIKLPPLPRLQVPRIDADIDLMDIRRLVKWAEDIANTHARASIEADRKDKSTKKYQIGDETYLRVFKASGLTNLSDMQAVLDAVESALVAVEADRKDHLRGVTKMMPSDDEIMALLQECGALATTNGIKAVRVALSRYGSGQPAANHAPCDAGEICIDCQPRRADGSCPDGPSASAEPVYAFRRKGQDAFVTCGPDRFAELQAKPHLFEARIFYAAPVAQEPMMRVRAQHRDGEVLEPSIEHTSPTFDNLQDGTVLDLYAAPVAAQPAASEEPMVALADLVNALRERHYGRMPDEVQQAYDRAWAIVYAAPVAAQPCHDAGEMCIDCQPRRADGSCPDGPAAPTPPADDQAQQDDGRVDAERYRLLRRGQHWSVINGIGDQLRGDILDDAIDAARTQQGGQS